jgi:hypothetical protein
VFIGEITKDVSIDRIVAKPLRVLLQTISISDKITRQPRSSVTPGGGPGFLGKRQSGTPEPKGGSKTTVAPRHSHF